MEKEVSFFALVEFECCVFLQNGKKEKCEFSWDFSSEKIEDFEVKCLKERFKEYLISEMKRKCVDISKIKYVGKITAFDNRNVMCLKFLKEGCWIIKDVILF